MAKLMSVLFQVNIQQPIQVHQIHLMHLIHPQLK